MMIKIIVFLFSFFCAGLIMAAIFVDEKHPVYHRDNIFMALIGFSTGLPILGILTLNLMLILRGRPAWVYIVLIVAIFVALAVWRAAQIRNILGILRKTLSTKFLVEIKRILKEPGALVVGFLSVCIILAILYKALLFPLVRADVVEASLEGYNLAQLKDASYALHWIYPENNHPIHHEPGMSTIRAWFALWGETMTDDMLFRMVSPFALILMICLIYLYARQRLGVFASSTIILLFVSLPRIVQESSNNEKEIVIWLLTLGSCLYTCQLLNEKRTNNFRIRQYIVWGVLLGLVVRFSFIGLILAPLIIFVFFLTVQGSMHKKVRNLVWTLCGMISVIGPLFIFRISLLYQHMDFALSSNLLEILYIKWQNPATIDWHMSYLQKLYFDYYNNELQRWHYIIRINKNPFLISFIIVFVTSLFVRKPLRRSELFLIVFSLLYVIVISDPLRVNHHFFTFAHFLWWTEQYYYYVYLACALLYVNRLTCLKSWLEAPPIVYNSQNRHSPILSKVVQVGTDIRNEIHEILVILTDRKRFPFMTRGILLVCAIGFIYFIRPTAIGFRLCVKARHRISPFAKQEQKLLSSLDPDKSWFIEPTLWINEHLPESAVVLTLETQSPHLWYYGKVRAFTLYNDERLHPFFEIHDTEEAFRFLEEREITHLQINKVYEQLGHGLIEKTAIRGILNVLPPESLIYENKVIKLYQLN